jgi:hypothetical protein
MQEETQMFLISLSLVFTKHCLKVIGLNTMLVPRVKVETIFDLKKVFPLTCFDVMTHLAIHLVEELDLCGPIHT